MPLTRSTPKSSLATLKGLLPFLAPYKWQFLVAGIALLVAAGATLAIPYAFKQMIDLGFGAAGAKSIQHVNTYFLALFGVACILAVATAARFYMVSWLGERVTADIRSAVYRHVVSQSPQFFETTQSGEVLSRLTTDTTLIQAVVGTSISMARAVVSKSGPWMVHWPMCETSNRPAFSRVHLCSVRMPMGYCTGIS